MIVVATADFRLYHALVTELRERDLEFTTVVPTDQLPPATSVVITGEGDSISSDRHPTVVVRPGAEGEAVQDAVELVRQQDGPTVIGIDPGDRPGVAVLRGDLVVAAYQVPAGDVPGVVRSEVDDDPDAIVRIGDGARLRSAQLINELGDVRIEVVDETGTTPTLGAGARNHGDILAAVNIARRSGDPIEVRTVDPTDGELTEIQDKSRAKSADNRAIDQALARRVAAGELTIEEALDRHRRE